MSEAFDTLAAAKALRGAEFDERQAEAITAVVRHAIGADRDKHAPKADIANMATKTDLAELEARITGALRRLQAAGLVAIMVGLEIFG